jgi:hypothetical protein
MSEIILKIMVEVLSVLSLATEQNNQGRLSKGSHIFISLVSELFSEKFGKQLLGESEIEDILRRLDRLTLDEARMTGTQTLQVVYGLVSNMKLVMDGADPLLSSLSTSYHICSCRWQDINGWHTAGSWCVQSTINLSVCETDTE